MESPVAYRYFGGEGNPPLVILHGLLGSSRNWQSVGKALVNDYEVFALDLRNHGNSPHTEAMTFTGLVDDLQDWLNCQGLKEVNIMGHSLGGKVAMAFACQYADRVATLLIIDIAPKNYPPHHDHTFDAMNGLDLENLQSRADADRELESDISDLALRQFLLTNLKKDPDGGHRWQVNLPVLTESLPTLSLNPLDLADRYFGPTLFIRGAHSDYVSEQDIPTLKRHFPQNVMVTLENTMHNPHQSNPDAFITCLTEFRAFLSRSDSAWEPGGTCTS